MWKTKTDHRQISFHIWRDKPAPKRIRNRRNTNWTIYENEPEGKVGMWFGRIDNPKDIETELTKVSSAIIQSFEKACPERKIGKRNFPGGITNSKHYVRKPIRLSIRRIEPENRKTGINTKKPEELLKEFSGKANENRGTTFAPI